MFLYKYGDFNDTPMEAVIEMTWFNSVNGSNNNSWFPGPQNYPQQQYYPQPNYNNNGADTFSYRAGYQRGFWDGVRHTAQRFNDWANNAWNNTGGNLWNSTQQFCGNQCQRFGNFCNNQWDNMSNWMPFYGNNNNNTNMYAQPRQNNENVFGNFLGGGFGEVVTGFFRENVQGPLGNFFGGGFGELIKNGIKSLFS